MKKATKFGIIALLLTTLATLSACSSKSKTEDQAEQALVEQTQELQAEVEGIDSDNIGMDEAFQPDYADLGASSSGLGH